MRNLALNMAVYSAQVHLAVSYCVFIAPVGPTALGRLWKSRLLENKISVDSPEGSILIAVLKSIS